MPYIICIIAVIVHISAVFVAFHGQLYMGDCYIILKTDWNDNSELAWLIHFWVGRDSTVSATVSATHTEI